MTGENKYNLAPRKQFCGANAGSTYPKMLREMYDEEFMSYLESNYIDTTDGKTKLPGSEEIKNKAIGFNYNVCLMYFDT